MNTHLVTGTRKDIGDPRFEREAKIPYNEDSVLCKVFLSRNENHFIEFELEFSWCVIQGGRHIFLRRRDLPDFGIIDPPYLVDDISESIIEKVGFFDSLNWE